MNRNINVAIHTGKHDNEVLVFNGPDDDAVLGAIVRSLSTGRMCKNDYYGNGIPGEEITPRDPVWVKVFEGKSDEEIRADREIVKAQEEASRANSERWKAQNETGELKKQTASMRESLDFKNAQLEILEELAKPGMVRLLLNLARAVGADPGEGSDSTAETQEKPKETTPSPADCGEA